MANGIYDVPTVVLTAALKKRGLLETDDEGNLQDVAKIARATATVQRQWREFIDSSSYGLLNSALYVIPTGNGRLKVVEDDFETVPEGGVWVALAQRFIDADFVRKHLATYIDWLEVMESGSEIEIGPKEGVSNLKLMAFGKALFQARSEVGSNVGFGDSEMLLAPYRVYDENAQRVSGITVGQVYYALALGKTLTENLTDLMREALRGARNQGVSSIKRHDTTDLFVKFFTKRRSELRTDWDTINIDSLPVLPNFTKTARTWGIEVEAAGARYAETPSDWDRKGDSSLVSAYSGGYDDEYEYRDPSDCPLGHDHREYLEDDEGNDIDNPYWDDPDDCEYVTGCNCSDCRDDNGGPYNDTGEFVSPILRYFHSRGLKQLTEDLANEPQNDSAGIHVHVGASDLTPKQIGGLVFAYQAIEPLLESSYQRETREYCKVRPDSETLSIIRSSKKAKHLNHRSSLDGGEVIQYGDRYVSLNLNALEAHGTVEFRAMGPVYEYNHLIKWAHFCREMVSIAAQDVPARVWSSVKTWDDVKRIFAKYGPETQAGILAEMETELSDIETSQLEYVLV